jgi:hypothetical protein
MDLEVKELKKDSGEDDEIKKYELDAARTNTLMAKIRAREELKSLGMSSEEIDSVLPFNLN